MKKCLPLFLILSSIWIWTTPALATSLENISRVLTTSATINQFIEKLVLDKAHQRDLKEIAKNYKGTQLPKSTLENGMLTLIEPSGPRMTIQVIDAKKGEFKINGHNLTVEVSDTYPSVSQKINEILKTKTSLWGTLLPEAQAQFKGLLYLLIGSITVSRIAGEALTSDCNEMVDFFRDNLKKQAKADHREIIPTKLTCHAEKAEADFFDTGLQTGQKAKVVYSRETGSQEAFIQIIVLDSKPTQNITYNYFQSKDNTPPVLKSTYINGTAVTDEKALQFHQKQFQIYRNSMGPLLYSVGKRCYECTTDEIAAALKRRGLFESRSDLDKKVMPSTR